MREKQEKVTDGEYGSESEDEEIEEELGYISPLDNVDPYVSFKQALTSMSLLMWECEANFLIPLIAFQMQNSSSYQTATTALTVEQQTLLMEAMNTAELNSAAPTQA